jgi:type II secretory pathway component PulJ
VNNAQRPMPRRRLLGLTLVELMIGILIGLLLLTAVIGVYLGSVRASNATLAMARLNQEVRTVTEIVAGELRRSGFRGADTMLSQVENPFAVLELADGGGCVRYRYNRGMTADESLGFRWHPDLNGVGVIEMETHPQVATCDSWVQEPHGFLTDPRQTHVTEFLLRTVDPTHESRCFTGSRCFNLNRRDESDETQTLDDWSWLPPDAYSFPCDFAEIEGVILAEPGDLLVENRELLLTVAAQSVRYPDLQTELTTSICIPNNRRCRWDSVQGCSAD